jgi:hypothetical protein
MKNNKKILTSIEPIFDNKVPIFQRIYNSVKETITNIITPPKAGNETISYKAGEEPLLKKIDSVELIHGYYGK